MRSNLLRIDGQPNLACVCPVHRRSGSLSHSQSSHNPLANPPIQEDVTSLVSAPRPMVDFSTSPTPLLRNTAPIDLSM